MKILTMCRNNVKTINLKLTFIHNLVFISCPLTTRKLEYLCNVIIIPINNGY